MIGQQQNQKKRCLPVSDGATKPRDVQYASPAKFHQVSKLGLQNPNSKELSKHIRHTSKQ